MDNDRPSKSNIRQWWVRRYVVVANQLWRSITIEIDKSILSYLEIWNHWNTCKLNQENWKSWITAFCEYSSCWASDPVIYNQSYNQWTWMAEKREVFNIRRSGWNKRLSKRSLNSFHPRSCWKLGSAYARYLTDKRWKDSCYSNFRQIWILKLVLSIHSIPYLPGLSNS